MQIFPKTAFPFALIPLLISAAPVQANPALCAPDSYVLLQDGAAAKVQQLTDDGQCMVQRFDRMMAFADPATLTASDKDTYRAARDAHRDGEQSAAASAENTVGAAPTACTPDLPVTLPDGSAATILDVAASTMCKVTLPNGDIGVYMLEQMLVAAP